MKSYLFLSLVALAAAAPTLKSKQEVWQIQAVCLERFNMKEDVYNEIIRTSGYLEVMEPMLCMMRDLDFWTDLKGYQVDNLMLALEHFANEKSLNKLKLREAIEGCLDEKREGEALKDWAFRDFKCFIDHEYLWNAVKNSKFYAEEKYDE